MCGQQLVYTKESIIYTVVLLLLNASYSHSFLQMHTFTLTPYIFLLAQIIPIYIMSSFSHCSSYFLILPPFYNYFTSFKLYIIFKCIMPYSEKGLQYPSSVCMLVVLLIVLYPFFFLFQVEEPASVFPIMEVLWW